MVKFETVLNRTMATASFMIPSPKSTAFKTGNLSGSIKGKIPWWGTWQPRCQSRRGHSWPAWFTWDPSDWRWVHRWESRRGRERRSRWWCLSLPGSWSCRNFRKTRIFWGNSLRRRWWAAGWWWKRSHCRTRSHRRGPNWVHFYVVDEDSS